MKTILVSGGAGFIGSHLIEELIKNPNNKIISLDNYFTGSEKNHISGVEYIKGETKDIEDLIKEKIDVIFHLGEYSRVMTSFEDIDLVWKLNVLGTFKVLEFCKKNKIRLVYAGSSTKFGEFNDGGEGENKSPYAYFKSTNTNLVNNYGEWFGLDYAITYFYNVFGEREIGEGKYATLIAIFTRKYKNGEVLSINAPGTQKRAFTYVKDIVCITSEGVYTNVFTKEGKKILIRRLLKEWENILPEKIFIRVHKSVIINLIYITKAEKWFNESFKLQLKHYPESIIASRRYASQIKKNLII